MKLSSLENHLLLFDIDGTLLNTGGDGKNAFIEALREIFENDREYPINFAGGIDYPIFHQFFRENQIDPSRLTDYWTRFKSIYHHKLASRFHHPWQLYEGVYETVSQLSRHAFMGIVTGNIRSTAYLKLSRFGLDRFFKTGGFGDFTISRSLLAKDAIHQSGNYFRKDFSNDQIILFGDTQKDIQSAIDNEIRGVLIDHDESKADESRIWGAHCRGNFADFNSLLKFLI